METKIIVTETTQLTNNVFGRDMRLWLVDGFEIWRPIWWSAEVVAKEAFDDARCHGAPETTVVEIDRI